MDATPFVVAAQELRQRFISLLDSLSAVRALSELECGRPRGDRELLVGALETLLQHQDLARSSVFLLEGDTLACAAGRDYTEVAQAHAEGGPRRLYLPRTFKLGEGVIGLAAQSRELQYCADCSRSLREALAAEISRARPGCDASWLTRQRGMFSLLGIGPEAVRELREQHHIYMGLDSRVNIAGLSEDRVARIAELVAPHLR